jgi:NAD(P)-dependent dehydrogenase (short-subunit alcohol dehydrogenase family)
MSMGATVGRLEGKRAVITGAASGIGEETTRLFIREGASVVLADVDDERGRRIAGECGDRARFVHADVAEDGARTVPRTVPSRPRCRCRSTNSVDWTCCSTTR